MSKKKSGKLEDAYTLVDLAILVHGRVRFVICDLDDAARAVADHITCHGDKPRPVGRPCDIKHLDVASDQKKEANSGTHATFTLCSVHFCLRGHTGDAE